MAWDEPGAGESSDVPAHFALADYAACLAGLIEALGLAPAHVCGLSWGGTVALALFRDHPGCVRTLVLADSYAGWRGSLSAEECETPARVRRAGWPPPARRSSRACGRALRRSGQLPR